MTLMLIIITGVSTSLMWKWPVPGALGYLWSNDHIDTAREGPPHHLRHPNHIEPGYQPAAPRHAALAVDKKYTGGSKGEEKSRLTEVQTPSQEQRDIILDPYYSYYWIIDRYYARTNETHYLQADFNTMFGRAKYVPFPEDKNRQKYNPHRRPLVMEEPQSPPAYLDWFAGEVIINMDLIYEILKL